VPVDLAALVVRAATLDEIVAFRHAELRPGLPRHAAAFDGDGDPTTHHFGAFAPEAVGCASFMSSVWEGEPAWQLRGMATQADVVRRGVGRALLSFAERQLRAGGGPRLLWCNARLGAVPFYERLGWVVVSDVFDVPTVGPHRAMLRR